MRIFKDSINFSFTFHVVNLPGIKIVKLFGSNNHSKSVQDAIPKGIHFLIHYCIDFGQILVRIWLNFWDDVWPGVVSMLR